MHCIRDSCATNDNRCSSHRLGAFSAHTIKISSIIATCLQADWRHSRARQLWHFPKGTATLRHLRAASEALRHRPRAHHRRGVQIVTGYRVSCLLRLANGAKFRNVARMPARRIDRGVRRAFERRSGQGGGAPASRLSRSHWGPRPTIRIDRSRHRCVRHPGRAPRSRTL
jgi:hypothetical protein